MFIKKLYMYVYIPNSDKGCDILQDRPILSTGKTTHDKQNCKYLNYNQNLAISPGGAQRQDCLTD